MSASGKVFLEYLSRKTLIQAIPICLFSGTTSFGFQSAITAKPIRKRSWHCFRFVLAASVVSRFTG